MHPAIEGGTSVVRASGLAKPDPAAPPYVFFFAFCFLLSARCRASFFKPGFTEVDAEQVDPDCARLAHQHRAGDLVTVDSQRHQARVAAASRTAPLDQLHASARCD